MIATECPPEHELMPLIDGLTVSNQISEHLAQCQACQKRLERLKGEFSALRGLLKDAGAADKLSPTDQRAAAAAAAATAVPTSIGRYLIAGLLDHGGQAAVYRAIHPTLHHDLVIKWGLRPVHGDMERDQLVGEGRLLASLDHPDIAKVFDLDFCDGRPFLVMEYVRGRSLEAYAKDHRPDARESAAIVVRVARAADAAHKRGVIHQDIKPHNILIDDSGRPKLIDFGMACIRAAWGDEADRNSAVGGTVTYMAPEQARGEAGEVNAAADVFALGAVLYRLLCGKAPFRGETIPEILERARKCDFDKSALATAGTPAGLTRICLIAMAAEPKDRYPNAVALATALENWLTQSRRNKRVAGAIAAVAAVVALTFGIVHWLGPVNPPAPPHHDVLLEKLQGQDIVTVVREEAPKTLFKSLPVNAWTDRFTLQFEFPSGWHGQFVALNTAGKVQEDLTAQEFPGNQGTVRLIYPRGANTVRPDASKGTELYLAVASDRPLDMAKIQALLESVGALPRLPSNTIVRLDNRGVLADQQGEPLSDEVSSSLKAVQDKLEVLREGLLKNDIRLMVGVAYSHGSRPASTQP